MVNLFDLFILKKSGFSIDEQKGTIEYDQEGERITVNFDQKLEVNH